MNFSATKKFIFNLFALFAIIANTSVSHAQPSTFSFENSSYTVIEGYRIEIPLLRLNGSSGDAQVFVQIRGESATAGVDFSRLEASDPLDFNVGAIWADGEVLDNVTGRNKSIVLQTTPDDDIEGNETLVLEIKNVVGGVPGSITRVTVVIEDEYAFGNDSGGSFSFQQSEYRIAEGEKVEIPIDRLGGASGEAQLLIQIRGETATTGEDFYRAESDDLYDFNVGVRWADGEVLDNVTGREKYIAIQSIADSLVGEGDETLILEMVDSVGDEIGPITVTRVTVEDNTQDDACSSPVLSRYVVWDFGRDDFGYGRNGLEEGFADGNVILIEEFADQALMVVGNHCVETVRYKLDGQADETVARVEFTKDGERYFLLAGGVGRDLLSDFANDGGQDCSNIDAICVSRVVEATPYGIGDIAGSVLTKSMIANLDVSNELSCSISAATTRELIFDLSDSPDERRMDDYRYSLGSPYKAISISRPAGSGNELLSGVTYRFDIMKTVNRAVTIHNYPFGQKDIVFVPDENFDENVLRLKGYREGDYEIIVRPDPPAKSAMGIYIYSEPREGSLSSSPNGQPWDFERDGLWFKADESGAIYYTPNENISSAVDDNFYYVIATPNPRQGVAAESFNACLNSKGQASMRIRPSAPVAVENTRPQITSISPLLSVMQVGEIASVTVNAVDREGALTYVKPQPGVSGIVEVSGNGPIYTIEGLSQGDVEIKFTVKDSDGLLATLTLTVRVEQGTDSNIGCVYPGGDTSNWGWSDTTKKSCPPVVSPPIYQERCVYPGGDTSQWGWDDVERKSCAPVEVGTGPSSIDTPAVSNCVYPGGDTSQWGWVDVERKSCAPADVDTGSSSMDTPAVGNCVYPGGDTSQWGWDDVERKSCPPF